MESYYQRYLHDISEAMRALIATDIVATEIDIDEALEKWADRAKRLWDERGHIFFVGNGASCTMAEHLSHDCFQNADLLTETISETAHLTAIANDLSYEEVFSYRISKSAEAKDMLVTISSSGNSPNIVAAIKTARECGLFVVTLSGMKANNKSRMMGDINLYVPLETYGMVESAHAVVLHCWLDLFLDRYKGGRH
jgi:D-sedoheptulose 7-phosphate isomerase